MFGVFFLLFGVVFGYRLVLFSGFVWCSVCLGIVWCCFYLLFGVVFGVLFGLVWSLFGVVVFDP